MKKRMNRGSTMLAGSSTTVRRATTSLLMIAGLVAGRTVAAEAESNNGIVVSYDAAGNSFVFTAPTDSYPKTGTLTILNMPFEEAKKVEFLLDETPVLLTNCKEKEGSKGETGCKYEIPDGTKAAKYTLHAKVAGIEVKGEKKDFTYNGKAAASDDKTGDKGDKDGDNPPPPTLFQADSFECDADKKLMSCAYTKAINFVDERMGYTAECKAKCTCSNESCQSACNKKCNWAASWNNKSPRNIYEDHIAAQDIAIAFFDDLGAPLYSLPQVDEDDRLFVVIVPVHGRTIGDVRVTACAARSALNVGGSFTMGDGGGVDPKDSRDKTPKVSIFVAEASDGCSSDGGFKALFTTSNGAKSKDPTKDSKDNATNTTEAKEIIIPTLSLNRITLGLGLVYDFSMETEFRAASVVGQNVPVVVQDKHIRGLMPPVAFISLRPIAVDLKRTREWYQSVSLNVGVSFTDPLDHLLLGVLVDPIPGLGLTAGYHFRREPVLGGGYQVGDRISGGEVPVDMRWATPQARDFFVGLNVDAGVLVRIAGGVLK